MENSNDFGPNQYHSNPLIALPNSTAVLVLGITSIVLCSCYGIVGLICGVISLVLYAKDKKLFLQNPQSYTPGSYSNLKAGRVCAIIGLILSAIYVLIIIAVIIIFGVAILTNPEHVLNQWR
jgi:hypothetical protein